jgi:hypothetical protein
MLTAPTVQVVWKRQEDTQGCAIACLAMVTGLAYRDVKAAWPPAKDFAADGITHFELQQFLGDRGIPHLFRWRFELGLNRVGAQVVRSDWPRPFAPVHIIGVGAHDVVLLADGTILDPMTEARRHINDVGEVSFMLGVWPDLRLPMWNGASC